MFTSLVESKDFGRYSIGGIKLRIFRQGDKVYVRIVGSCVRLDFDRSIVTAADDCPQKRGQRLIDMRDICSAVLRVIDRTDIATLPPGTIDNLANVLMQVARGAELPTLEDCADIAINAAARKALR